MSSAVISENAEGVTGCLPCKDVHKRVWRGNVLQRSGVRAKVSEVRGSWTAQKREGGGGRGGRGGG